MEMENIDELYHTESDLSKIKGKFVIINLRTMDFFKNDKKEMLYFNNRQDACEYLGFCEFNECSVLEIIHTYLE